MAVSFCAEKAAQFARGLLSRNPWGSYCDFPTPAEPRHLWLAAQQRRALSYPAKAQDRLVPEAQSPLPTAGCSHLLSLARGPQLLLHNPG